MNANNGGPAFPMPIAGCNDGGIYNTMQQSGGELGGMTLRDYFAAKAMQGLLASVIKLNPMDDHYGQGLTQSAYALADAMLRARATGEQP